MQHSTWSMTKAEQIERIHYLSLLAMLLWCTGLCPLPVHAQSLICNAKFLLHRAALSTLTPHLVFILAVPQAWNLGVEPYEFFGDSCLELALVPLKGFMNDF